MPLSPERLSGLPQDKVLSLDKHGDIIRDPFTGGGRDQVSVPREYQPQGVPHGRREHLSRMTEVHGTFSGHLLES